MKKRMVLFFALMLVFYSCFSDYYVQAAPKKPKLNVKKLNMTVGTTFQIRVYNMKKKYKVTYTSSKPAVASVKTAVSNGKRASINALAVGSATVTATVRKGKKQIRTLKCKVKVSPNAIGIKFMLRKSKLRTGSKMRLETIIKPNTSEEQPIFESADPDIASVNSHGVVTGISPGTVTITATLLSCDLATSCTITVLPKEENETAKIHKYAVNKVFQDI